MKKAERKRVARDKKARAKAARKAKNQAPSPVGNDRGLVRQSLGDGGSALQTAAAKNPASEGSTAESVTVTDNGDGPSTGGLSAEASAKAEGARATAQAEPSTPVERPLPLGIGGRPFRQEFLDELTADPELRAAIVAANAGRIEEIKLEDAAEQAEEDFEHAREKVAEAEAADPAVRARRKISDERALEMLEDAAECTHEVLMVVKETLKGVSPERIEAAREVLNAKPQSREAGQPGGVDGRRLPRRAPDPVVTLLKIELQASSLLKRILAKTNPNAGKKVA